MNEPIQLRSRDEMLAAVLPIEVHGYSVDPHTGKLAGRVVYRFETEHARDTFGDAENAIMRGWR